MTATVLSVASRAVLDACRQLGLDPEAISSAAGLTHQVLYDANARIPADRADALWRHAFEQADDPSLALHAAEALPFGAYKVLDFITANAPTVGEGLTRVARYFALVDDRGRFEVEVQDPVSLRMHSAGGEIPQAAQEYTFAALVLRSRACAGAPWPLQAVDFTFDQPADSSEHERIFGCPIRFGRPEPRLLIAASTWDLPVRGADAALFAVLEDHAAHLLAQRPTEEPSLVSQLKAHLHRELRGGDPSMRSVARQMGMGERTLQRRLKELGLAYAGLVSETRHELSRGYLREPSVSIAEIAWLLGYSEQSAFTRAFRSWSGQTPAAWRSAHA
ncbi:MAG: AraC family transcriptional regulator [Nannocystaceae bacterium]|nr:AraC family transcriptional regulator [Nannocystaceae bacterium]